MTDHPPSSAPEKKVPLREKIGLGFGLVASQGAHNTVYVLAHQVLNVSLGMNPALITLLASIQRIWNAILDPVFGRWSDNLRTRFGRRRPLLFLGAFPLAASFAGLWCFPRFFGGTPLFLYLLVFSLLLYGSLSLYSVALGGLQIEVAADYHERTRVVAFMQLCFLGFTIAVQWFFSVIQIFRDQITGLRWIALGTGAFFLAAALTPVCLVRERFYGLVANRQGRLRLADGIRAARRNPPFLRLLVAEGSMSLGFFLASILGVYLNYYYIFHGNIKSASLMQGWLGSAFQVAAFGSVFLFRRLSVRIGKRRTFQMAALAHLASAAAKLLLFLPAHPCLQVVAYLAGGAGFAGTELLSLSMLADVVDLDELQTGVRREGLYWSMLSWGDKICASAGTLISGLVLIWIGFDTKLGGAQPPATMLLMRLFYAGFPLVGALIAILAINSFSITEKSAHAMKEELERRRGLGAPA